MRHRSLIPGALALLLLGASCSVKEARGRCPCQVDIDLTAFSEITRSVRLRVGDKRLERRLTTQDSLLVQTEAGQGSALPVWVWTGAEGMLAAGDTVRVPLGKDCDSVYLFWQAADARSDRLRLDAVPHKSFATVFLSLSSADDDGPVIARPLRGQVVSRHSGLRLPEGRPVEGRLAIPLRGDGPFIFRLPRQQVESRLAVDLADADGKELSYPLGEWILESGYDWNAPDLNDLVVGLDLSSRAFEVRVIPWQAGFSLLELF